MTDKTKAKSLARRDFLKTAGLATGAVGAAVALASPQAKAATAPAAKGEKTGYRETEHVRRYYELAR
jgi:nitrous oxide reductase